MSDQLLEYRPLRRSTEKSLHFDGLTSGWQCQKRSTAPRQPACSIKYLCEPRKTETYCLGNDLHHELVAPSLLGKKNNSPIHHLPARKDLFWMFFFGSKFLVWELFRSAAAFVFLFFFFFLFSVFRGCFWNARCASWRCNRSAAPCRSRIEGKGWQHVVKVDLMNVSRKLQHTNPNWKAEKTDCRFSTQIKCRN